MGTFTVSVSLTRLLSSAPAFDGPDANCAIAILLYNDSQRTKAEAVVHRMVKRAVDMEGTVTGEHGVGLVKRDYLDHELGVTTVDAMRKVRFHFSRWCWRLALTMTAETGL